MAGTSLEYEQFKFFGASYDEVGGQRRRRLLPPIFRMPALPPRRSEVERDDVRE